MLSMYYPHLPGNTRWGASELLSRRSKLSSFKPAFVSWCFIVMCVGCVYVCVACEPIRRIFQCNQIRGKQAIPVCWLGGGKQEGYQKMDGWMNGWWLTWYIGMHFQMIIDDLRTMTQLTWDLHQQQVVMIVHRYSRSMTALTALSSLLIPTPARIWIPPPLLIIINLWQNHLFGKPYSIQPIF